MFGKNGASIDRRTFVGGAFAGLTTLSLNAETPRPSSGSIPTREFGKTGVKVTIIGQAGARLNMCRSREAAGKIVRHAYDLGINYFDCAHAYWNGHSEEAYGDVIPDFRKDIFLTTKSTQRTRAGAENDLHASLIALRTDHLDLWQIHDVRTRDDIEAIFAPGGCIEAFETAKNAGKCRFIGFTGHHDPDIHNEMMMRYDKWDSTLMPLHAADPAYLSFKKNTLPRAVERGIGIQAIKVFANAFLLRTLSVEECLRYALTLPISCAALGSNTVSQLNENVRIAQSFKPYTPEEMAQVEQLTYTSAVGSLHGPALEYWKLGGVWK
jgi:predicted aldo/keto reductase-like oxidoreductase